MYQIGRKKAIRELDLVHLVRRLRKLTLIKDILMPKS